MKSTNKPSAAERFLLREKGDANSSKNNNVTFPSWVENLDKTLTKKKKGPTEGFWSRKNSGSKKGVFL